ncbi:hypothetical protein M0813_19832 [Anaeramoeba flamelloides]|uniref:Uncharacterized protein n=1 Tax=Anaeramoeba flamelloides TaxID=1746091 RepID=A0ABQ8YNG8_9EUKA|nr:hypothetical protein M0813_19832 [Anaeramoeba flamelloides]
MSQTKKEKICVLFFFVLLVVTVYVIKPPKWAQSENSNRLTLEEQSENSDPFTLDEQTEVCYNELPKDPVYFSKQITCPIEQKRDDLQWQVSSLKNSLMNACQRHSPECVKHVEGRMKDHEMSLFLQTVSMRNNLIFGKNRTIKYERDTSQNVFSKLLKEFCLDRVSETLSAPKHSTLYQELLVGGIEEKKESSMQYIIKDADGNKLGEISPGQEFDLGDRKRVDIHAQKRKENDGNITKKYYPFVSYHRNTGFLDRVNKRIERIEKEEESQSGKTHKKLNLVLILNDALSHLRYVRIFSVFREWLDKKVNDGQIEYFAFRRYHVMGWYSPENQIPAFSGWTVDYARARRLGHGGEHRFCGNYGDPVADNTCDRLIYNRYRSQGYLTVDARDRFDGRYTHECHRQFVKKCNKEEWTNQYADVIIPQQYYKGFKIFESFSVLTWLEQVLNEHDGEHPIFATATTMNFHSVPSKVSTSLWDIMSFLENVDFENTMIILHADHGFHYTNHVYSEAGYNEHKYPQLLFIMPKRFLDKKPWIRKNLQKNVDRLASHFDLYTTLREFPQTQAGHFDDRSQGERRYSHLKPNTYNLFTETIPEDRTCEQANINSGYCLCVEWTKSSSDTMKEAAVTYAKQCISHINTKTQVPGANCLPLKYVSIENLEQTSSKKQMRYHLLGKVDGKEELVRFQIFWSDKRKNRVDAPIRMSKMSEAEIKNQDPERLDIDPHICFLPD